MTNFNNVELFLVDLASHASVNTFCEKIEKDVPRLDILVENAGVALPEFIPTPDGWEHQYVLESGYNRDRRLILRIQGTGEPSCNGTTLDPSPSATPSNRIQVHRSSFGLCVNRSPLLVPAPQSADLRPRYSRLVERSVKVKGARHRLLSFRFRASDLFHTPRKPMESRYAVSKLLNLFFARELASRLPEDCPLVVNAVNPCFCISGVRRHVPLFHAVIFWFWDKLLAWSTERGSRQLVFAALGNQENSAELKGSYITSSEVAEPSDYVISDEGDKVQKQLWVSPSY